MWIKFAKHLVYLKPGALISPVCDEKTGKIYIVIHYPFDEHQGEIKQYFSSQQECLQVFHELENLLVGKNK